MSILSGVVLMVAIGSVVQNSEQLTSWFEGTPAEMTLMADEAQVNANDLAMLDVLANDKALDEDAAARLVVTNQPPCGRVFVQNGALQYLADGNCLGRHVFSYGIIGSDIASAEVTVRVRPALAPSMARNTAPDDAAAANQEVAAAKAGSETPDPEPAPEVAADAPANAPKTVENTPEVDIDPGKLALARPPTTDLAPQSGSAGEGESVSRGTTGPALPDASEDLRAPALGARPTAPKSVDGPGAPSAPEIAAEPNTPVIADAPRGIPVASDLAAAPSTPEAPRADAQAALPAAVVPRTDLADLDAPEQPGLIDELGELTYAPLPAARPSEALVGMNTLGGSEPDAGTAAPDAPRPATSDAPGAPTAPQPGDETVALASANDVLGAARTPIPTLESPQSTFEGGLFMPERLDADPLGDAEPVINFELSDLSEVMPVEDGFVRISEASAAPGTLADGPSALGAAMRPTMSLALIDIPEASAAPSGGTVSVDLAPDERAIERAGPPAVMDPTDSEIALGAPSDGLGPVLEFGAPLTLAPVDTTEPPLLAEPADKGDRALETAALDAGAQAEPASPQQDEPAGEQVAALPAANEPCVVPPSLTLELGRAAITTVHVNSPCHAGTAAAIEYNDLSLAFALDAEGKGQVAVPGFERKSSADLRFADGEMLEFQIPFKEIEKVERVALSWDMPIRLDLHALEFGAGEGSDGHVGPDSPRSFRDVRRTGGGFLQTYEPLDGEGRHARIYTHYLRRGGENGIVTMMIDFASRSASEEATCGQGELASPAFTVTRTARGTVERPLRRTLAAMPCEKVPEEDGMISNAVSNLVITY